MATNYVQPGDTLTFPAPAGGVTSGVGVLIGKVFVVALNTAAAGVNFDGAAEGVFDLAKTSAQAWTAGDKIYWDDANQRCDNAPSGEFPCIGSAVADASNPSSTGRVLLDSEAEYEDETGPAATSKNTAGDVTLTAAEVLSGIVVADPNGAGRTYTLPTAALLVAARPGSRVGDIVQCLIVNGADAAETITLAAGAGGAFDANQTASSQVIPQNASKLVLIRLTDVAAGSEAYVVYA